VKTSAGRGHEVREVEWQFDALDLRPVLRWLAQPNARPRTTSVTATPTNTTSQLDLYLDTDDWRFHRTGFALRLRRPAARTPTHAQVTLKQLDSHREDEAGPLRRREITETIDGTEVTAVLRASGAVGERVRAVSGRKPLRPLFEVRTRRQTLALEYQGSNAGEVALDETAIRSPSAGPPVRFRRVEVELAEHLVETIAPFVDELRSACALQPARLSKYEAGLLSTGLQPAQIESFGTIAVEPEASSRELALAVLRRHFSAMIVAEPGTILGDEIEELHSMRVACRRLRAALMLFADVLPSTAANLRQDLAQLGQTLGRVRDLDVQLAQLAQWQVAVGEPDRPQLEPLRRLLEQQRGDARTVLLEALHSQAHAAFMRRFSRFLRARHLSRDRLSATPAKSLAPDLIERRFRSVRKAAGRIGPHAQPSDYHRLRIRCKQLRYTLEFSSDLYPGQTATLIKRLVDLQDILGLHQDADIAIDRLRQLAAQHGRDLPPETVFAMGEIAARYRHEMDRLQALALPAYAKVRRKTWKPFHKEIERQRPLLPTRTSLTSVSSSQTLRAADAESPDTKTTTAE
jgi:CHAD domain-containing protein